MTTEEFESYDEIKDKVKKDYNRFHESAKTLIPKLVNALKIENPRITKEEIKDIILKDFLQYWSRRTIMDALGNEYKAEQQQEAGKKSKEGKKDVAAIIAANNSQQTVTEDENITKKDSNEKPEHYPQESPDLKKFRDEKGTLEQTHQPIPQPTQQQEDTTTEEEPNVIYDPNLINNYVKKIAKLEEEIAKLKVERIPTRSNKFEFNYPLEVKDQILPLIITVFPDKQDGYVRLDKARLNK